MTRRVCLDARQVGPRRRSERQDAPGFGRELAPPRERTTIDAFTGSMEAMEVDQEMIDLRAEVDRLRAAAEAYEAGEMTNTSTKARDAEEGKGSVGRRWGVVIRVVVNRAERARSASALVRME